MAAEIIFSSSFPAVWIAPSFATSCERASEIVAYCMVSTMVWGKLSEIGMGVNKRLPVAVVYCNNPCALSSWVCKLVSPSVILLMRSSVIGVVGVKSMRQHRSSNRTGPKPLKMWRIVLPTVSWEKDCSNCVISGPENCMRSTRDVLGGNS